MRPHLKLEKFLCMTDFKKTFDVVEKRDTKGSKV